MNSKLGLLGRGIILVSAPLLTQLVMAFCLVFLLVRVQDQAQKEAFVRDLITQTYTISMAVPEIAALLIMQRQSLGLVSEEVVAKRLSTIEKKIGVLCRQASKNPLQADNVAKLEISKKHLHDEVTSAPGQEILEHDEKVQERMLYRFTGLFDTLGDMLRIEKVQLAAAPKEREAIRAAVILALSFGVIASCGMAVWLAKFYAAGIRDPLLQLAENARLLSLRQPLLSLLKGKDEIAALDQTLHAVDAALSAAAQRERALIDNAADLICTIDGSGNFREVNSFSQQMLGYPAAQLRGSQVSSLFAEGGKSEFEKQFADSVARQNECRFEITMCRTDGSHIDTSWSALWSDRDQVLFCVIHDITERKKIDRLKQEYIAMISHDLRTPLSSVISGIQLLSSGAKGELSTEATQDLLEAEQNLQWLITLVNDLLDFEKLTAGQMKFDFKPIQLSKMLNEAVSIIGSSARKKNLALLLPDSDLVIAADQNRLVQLMVNLLGNAIKYSPENGKIEVSWTKEADAVRLSVTDEGPGIPEEYQDRIFAPFEQVPGVDSAKHEGTGLGLAICKLIAEGQGGKIGLKSQPGQGSNFWFELPSKSYND